MINLRDKAIVEDLIKAEHWEQGRSLRAIEKRHGITTSLLVHWCKRHGILFRSQFDSLRVYKQTAEGRAKQPRGEQHWAHGRRKESDPFFAKHSQRMSIANPATDYTIMTRMMAGRAGYLRKHPTPAEQRILETWPACQAGGMVFQYPLGIYILDFAFPPMKVALEIDGLTHLRKSRHAHDIIRTAMLIQEGWTLIRHQMVCRLKHPRGMNLHRVERILAALVPDFQISSPLPSMRQSHYGVLICCQEYPAGVRIYTPDDPRFIALVHRLHDASPPSSMGHHAIPRDNISNVP